MTSARQAPTTAGSSRRIIFGLVLSRILGIVRDRLLLALGGVGATNDILMVALKFSNTLQNLLGEQSLSASFIPAYTERLGDARATTGDEARRLAGAAFARLLIIAGSLGIAGSVFAPQIGLVLADRGAEAVSLLALATRFLFPMAALLVLAAWCLAVLNSHRRFFLPYLAPVFWNLGVLAGLGLYALMVSDPTPRLLVLYFSVGSLVGGGLQLGVQLPFAIRINGGLPLTLKGSVSGLREVQNRFFPVLMGRGSLQVIGVGETLIAAKFLSEGTTTGLGVGQRLFFLTIMVTSMVQAIVYLPEFSRIKDPSVLHGKFREALHGVWFLVIPTMVGVVVLGYPLVTALFLGGRFDASDAALVYLVFAIYALGLVPTASSRILQAALYSKGQTRLPAVVGTARAGCSLTAAWFTMHWWDGLPVAKASDWLGLEMPASQLTLGALAFATSSAVAAYAEWFWLRHRARVQGSLGLLRKGGQFGGLAFFSLIPALAVWRLYQGWLAPGLLFLRIDLFFVGQGVLVIGTFAAVYLLAARHFRIDEFERLAGAAASRGNRPTGGGSETGL